jgi:alpha-L-rhamnosidase
MRRRARFICPAVQQPDQDANFRQIVSRGPVKRDDGTNRWYLYRRTFDLNSSPVCANADITVDGRYQLFVNGEWVGRGPGRSSPEFQRVDQLDLAPYLSEGKNCIAVLVHVYGTDTAWYEQCRDYWQGIFGDGGFYFDAVIKGGSSKTILSDCHWRCIRSHAWKQDVPKSGWGQDFIEVFDARKMPTDWNATGFDDSDWPHVTEMVLHTDANDHAKGWMDIEPFPTLIAREIPALTESTVAAETVVGIYAVESGSNLPLDERVYKETLSIGIGDSVSDATALLTDDDQCTVVHTKPGKDVAILIRFERLHSGYPFIEIDALGGEVIELAVAETIPGEYLGEAESLPRIRRVTFMDCAHVFRYTARPGQQRFEKFEWTAVSYMQIVVRNAPQGLRIRHAGSIYTHYPVENLGAFECSDDMLNQLWEIGRYTTLQCTHDAWEDCPGREKRQWLGDGIVHYLIGAAAFGPSTQAIDRQFLLHGMESQRPDGLLQMFAPGDNHRNGIIIPDFCLHWICAAHHYFMHTGDLDTVEQIFPAIQKVLSWFERQTGPNQLINNLPYWHFIEWAHTDRKGESATINAMLAGANVAAADLANALGYQRAKDAYRIRASEIADALNTRHWNEQRGVYVDSVDAETGIQGKRVGQQANAAMIYWDIAPPDRWERMIEQITATEKLKLTAVPPMVIEAEDFDEQHDIVLANTYFSHFVFSALAKARRFDLALEQMRRLYEPMLATGTTTLWESFDPEASLCHAFSASPVYQLSANALGVQPIAAGFSTALIAPQPGDLRQAAGTYATVRGDINIAWTATENSFDLQLDLPPDMHANVIPPPGYQSKDGDIIVAHGSHQFQFSKAP